MKYFISGHVLAAIAFGLVLAAANLLRLFFVFSILNISPYNRRYAKFLVPVILSGGSVYLLQAATPALSDLFWLKPLIGLFVAYVVLVLLSLRLSLDDDDRLILNAVVSKTRLVTTGKSL